MTVAKISTEHKTQLDKVEEEFRLEKLHLNANEKSLKESLELFQTKNGELNKKLQEETMQRCKLQEEICRSVKTQEEEV